MTELINNTRKAIMQILNESNLPTPVLTLILREFMIQCETQEQLEMMVGQINSAQSKLDNCMIKEEELNDNINE